MSARTPAPKRSAKAPAQPAVGVPATTRLVESLKDLLDYTRTAGSNRPGAARNLGAILDDCDAAIAAAQASAAPRRAGSPHLTEDLAMTVRLLCRSLTRASSAKGDQDLARSSLDLLDRNGLKASVLRGAKAPPLPEPSLYLLVIEGDVCSSVRGPYKDDDERLAAAREHRADAGIDDGLYRLNIGADGVPETADFGSAEMDLDEEPDDTSTVTKRNGARRP